MPPVPYALAPDTLIGVVRARTAAMRLDGSDAPDDESTPRSALGGLVLWLLRLAMSPRSTLRAGLFPTRPRWQGWTCGRWPDGWRRSRRG